jgi:hypothetical protein
MELEIVALPGLGCRAVAARHAPFHRRELVVGRDHAALPVDVARGKRRLHRVALQQHAHGSQLLEIRGGYGRHLEATPTLGEDQPFRGQAVEDLAQRADARAVLLAQPLERQALPRLQTREHDVGPEPDVGLVALGGSGKLCLEHRGI